MEEIFEEIYNILDELCKGSMAKDYSFLLERKRRLRELLDKQKERKKGEK